MGLNEKFGQNVRGQGFGARFDESQFDGRGEPVILEVPEDAYPHGGETFVIVAATVDNDGI